MDPSAVSYTEMYEGPINVVDRETGVTTEENDSVYWHGDIGFEVTRTHKLALDKPTILIRIPAADIARGSKLWLDVETEQNEQQRAKLLTAAADCCLRAFVPYIDRQNELLFNSGRPDVENGRYYIQTPNGEVLMRNGAFFSVMNPCDYILENGRTAYLKPAEETEPAQLFLCILMQVQFPRGRQKKMIQMLTKDMPSFVYNYVHLFNSVPLDEAIELARKQFSLRQWLNRSDYCAFIANGSILPRTDDTDLPLTQAVPFNSPPEDEITANGIVGMGIRRGVTVITGGGYSGKSTLLNAISAGIYDHCTGDGRELVITDETAMEIVAEDGRSIGGIDISPFLKWLPHGVVSHFSTRHASGSTSQAANIIEAVGYGSTLLLIDEDRSATNFMIRDSVMRALVRDEPITPFTERVRELYEKNGVSTILVIGGSCECLAVADRVYMMNAYRLDNVTCKAKALSRTACLDNLPPANYSSRGRITLESFRSRPQGIGKERVFYSETGFITFGDEVVDIRALHNAISDEQRNAIAFVLRSMANTCKDENFDPALLAECILEKVDAEGMDVLYSSAVTQSGRFLDLPRIQEVLAVVDRMRYTRMAAE